MIYKHKQLSTKLVGADFSAPRASFLSLLPACAELVEASKCHCIIMSNLQTTSNNIIMSKCHCIIMSNFQIFKFSNLRIFKSSTI